MGFACVVVLFPLMLACMFMLVVKWYGDPVIYLYFIVALLTPEVWAFFFFEGWGG